MIIIWYNNPANSQISHMVIAWDGGNGSFKGLILDQLPSGELSHNNGHFQ